MIRLLVVDDHQMFADALAVLFQGDGDVDVVGSVRTAEEALGGLDGTRPDVILMDVDLPGINGISATRQLAEAHPDVRVIVITALLDPRVVEEAADAGAVGFVSKQRAADELVAAVRAAAAGEEFFGQSVLRVLRSGAGGERPEHRMTSRELEILQGLADGMTTEQLAAALFVSRRTVQTHVQNILTKLGVRSKLQAVLYGLRHGLVRLKALDEPGPADRLV